jgi:hypothetical protein
MLVRLERVPTAAIWRSWRNEALGIPRTSHESSHFGIGPQFNEWADVGDDEISNDETTCLQLHAQFYTGGSPVSQLPPYLETCRKHRHVKVERQRAKRESLERPIDIGH